MYAAISPRDNAVGLLRDEDGGVQVLDRLGVPTEFMSAERYLSRHPDTLVVDVLDEKHAVDVLSERATMSLCLDMTLLLFDRDVSIQTREELARELNCLFQNNVNRDYVLGVILCSPLPPIADVTGVEFAVESSSITREVVTSILDCQHRVRLIFESWLLVKQLQIVQQAGAERVFALLSRHGVFRQLALNAVDTEQLAAIKATLTVDAQLCAQLDTAPRIVLPLVNELSKKLPVGKTKQPAIKGQADTDVSKSKWHEYDVAKPQHTSDHAAFSAAVSQVERIADLYGQLKDTQADSILTQLIAEQRKHSDCEQHIVKSLCNVATRVNARGRPEISLNCLTKALDFPNGIDSQLYLQIGKGLRDLSKFDEAVNCYDRAEQLDNGLLSETILLERIRIRVARGNYEQACSDYRAMIPDLQFQLPALSGLGTLYRKMGRIRESRETYLSCRQIDENFHSAYAGLAEIRKQTGKPHQAIAEYNALIRRFNNLEIGSKKVYDLARSHLFRLTRQYDKSESVLNELTNDFPGDRNVHLQFAKLLELRGYSDQAQAHFEDAKGPSLQDLGRLIFAKASKGFDPALIRDGLANLQSSLLPEDKGLASCIEAYDLITTSEFERAQHVLRDATFVDRLVGDFANVLRFHGQRKISSSFDYKSDYRLCRVAKRSDRSLRGAMHSIASGDYDEADRFESEFLLRVVA